MVNAQRMMAIALASFVIASSADTPVRAMTEAADKSAVETSDESAVETSDKLAVETSAESTVETSAESAVEMSDKLAGERNDGSAADIPVVKTVEMSDFEAMKTQTLGETASDKEDSEFNDISTFVFGKIPDQGWTGKTIKPIESIAISNGTKMLKIHKDFKVTGYINNIKPGKNTAKIVVKGIGDYKGKAEIPFTITKDLIGGTFKVSAVNDKEGVILSWTKATNAKKYSIYRKKGSKWKYLGIVGASKRTFTDTLLKNCNGKKYYYRVYAIPNKTSKKVLKGFHFFRLTHPVLQKPIISSSFSKRPSVYWVTNKASDGYQIQFKKSNSVIKRKVRGGKKAGCQMPKSWKKVQKVRIRCYKTIKGETYYSPWGKWKKVRIS